VPIVIGVCIVTAVGLVLFQRSHRIGEQQQKLVGRWIRPDGGYIIHILDVATDGRLEAAYYNPRPIHIAQAQVTQSKDGPQLFIELRDTGYPGATYNLLYDHDRDTLVGIYYQPTVNQYFDVIFVRMR